jgi:hypothetical protein
MTVNTDHDQSKTKIADHMTVNTDHDQSKTKIADHMTVNTDPLDSTFLADVFSEDMMFSQNLSFKTCVNSFSGSIICSNAKFELPPLKSTSCSASVKLASLQSFPFRITTVTSFSGFE